MRVEFATVDESATNIYPVAPQERGRRSGDSQLPAVAAGCGAGCAIYLLASMLVMFVFGIGFNLLDLDEDNSILFPGLMPMGTLGAAAIVGYLVYRTVRNRRR